MTIYVYEEESSTVYYRTRYAVPDNLIEEAKEQWQPDDGDFKEYLQEWIEEEGMADCCTYCDREVIDEDNWESDGYDLSGLDNLEEEYPELFPDSEQEQYLGDF